MNEENIYKVGLNAYRNVFRASAKHGTSPTTEQLIDGVVDSVVDKINEIINNVDLNDKSHSSLNAVGLKLILLNEIKKIRNR